MHISRRVIIRFTQMWTLKATVMTSLARHALSLNSGRNTMGVTSHFLIWLKAYSTRWNPSLALCLGQEPVTKHVPGPEGKNLLLFCKIDIVLSQLLMIYHYTHGCMAQLASEGFLYVADSDEQRETHNWSRCREWNTEEYSALNGTSIPPPPRAHGSSWRVGRRMIKAGGGGWLQGNHVLQTHQSCCTWELTVAMKTRTRPTQIQASMEWGSVYKSHSYPRSYWKMITAGGGSVFCKGMAPGRLAAWEWKGHTS